MLTREAPVWSPPEAPAALVSLTEFDGTAFEQDFQHLEYVVGPADRFGEALLGENPLALPLGHDTRILFAQQPCELRCCGHAEARGERSA